MATLKWILTFVLFYGGFVALLYVAQRSLQYFPESHRTAPAAAGLPEAEEVVLDTADGERVIVWHLPPRGDKPVFLYFHGNGASLRWRVDRFRALTADGSGLVALSYRGYGGSSGSPTEAGLIDDGLAAYAFAAIALSGRSHRALGRVARQRGGGCAGGGKAGRQGRAGVAIQLGRRRRCSPVLVRAGAPADEGPVPLGLAHRQGDGAGAGYARRPRLRSCRSRLGERLYALINAPKRFVRFPGGGAQ